MEAEESAENKITDLEQRGQELQAFIQRLTFDLQNVSFILAFAGCLLIKKWWIS